MTDEINAADAHGSTIALDEAASLLYSVARSCPDNVDPGVVLECLHAADQLRVAGATAERCDLRPAELEQTIRDALAVLASLPLDTYAQPSVLTASEAAHLALEYLTG